MKKIIASVFVVAFMCLSVGSVNAAAEIKNNGAGSNNKIKVKSTSSSVVSQTNTAVFVTEVGATTSTGGNKANKNTGGSTSITSGAALTNVGIANTANVNTNSNGQCGCGCCDQIGNWNVEISGNGADSWNKVKVSENCTNALIQSNSANIYNGIVTVTQTGGNTSSKNTNGDVTVTTGAAATTIVVENNANINTN